MKIIQLFRNLLTHLKVVCLLPFFSGALVLLLTFAIFPFYALRTLISTFVKWRDPQVTRILTGLSASLLRDYDCHQRRPMSTIVVALRARGPSQIFPLFCRYFSDRVLEKKDNSSNSLQFPELRQHYKQFLGYIFLRRDPTFEASNHLTLYPTLTPLNHKEFAELWEKLMVKPFRKNRSPWEVVVVENVDLEDSITSVAFLRIHHGLCDGFSVQKILGSLCDNFELPQRYITPLPKSQRIFFNIRTLVRGPYDLLHKMITLQEPYHSLHLPAKKLAKAYFVVESNLFKVDHVTKIKKQFDVAFTTILVATAGGGIRRFLLRNRKPFPKVLSLGIPFILPSSSGKLENEFLIAPITLPVDMTEAKDRIQNIQGQLEALHRSSISHMLRLSIDCLSCLPVPLMRALTTKSVFSTAYSTLPGPQGKLEVDGKMWLEEVNFTYGTGAASLGLCVSSITYEDKLRMTLTVDRNLIGSREKAEELVQCLREEFYCLLYG